MKKEDIPDWVEKDYEGCYIYKSKAEKEKIADKRISDMVEDEQDTLQKLYICFLVNNMFKEEDDEIPLDDQMKAWCRREVKRGGIRTLDGNMKYLLVDGEVYYSRFLDKRTLKNIDYERFTFEDWSEDEKERVKNNNIKIKNHKI